MSFLIYLIAKGDDFIKIFKELFELSLPFFKWSIIILVSFIVLRAFFYFIFDNKEEEFAKSIEYINEGIKFLKKVTLIIVIATLSFKTLSYVIPSTKQSLIIVAGTFLTSDKFASMITKVIEKVEGEGNTISPELNKITEVVDSVIEKDIKKEKDNVK